MFSVNRDPSAAELRSFGRAMAIGFSVLAVLLWLGAWRKSGSPLTAWSGSTAQMIAVFFLILGWGLLVLSRVSLGITRTVYVGWMSATAPVGIALSTVLLTILYFLLLPVFSLIVRASDPLRKKLGGATYWEDYKPHEPTLERMRRPF